MDKFIYSYDKQDDKVRNNVIRNYAFSSEDGSYEKTYERDNSEERVSHFHSEDVVGKSILDFGCAEGGVLLACLKRGAEKVVGIDHNPWAIATAKEKASRKTAAAEFICGDMENKAFLTKLQPADTVLLLAILETSDFSSTEGVIANVSRFAKNAFYYEGHYSPESRVRPLYELLIFTDFTRFEYLGRFDWRILIRCGREIYDESQVPDDAVTSDDSEEELLGAEEIYVYTDADKNPAFSRNCRLIQFVKR